MGRLNRRLVMIALLFGLAGCAEELMPPPSHTTTVTGRLLLMGRPVGRGWLEFVPIEGTVGVLRSARLQQDGTFRAERVPVGRVAIRLVGAGRLASGDPMIDRFLVLVSQRYLIHRDVKGPSTPDLEIDLGREAVASVREAFGP
jgi:hypothetical protein